MEIEIKLLLPPTAQRVSLSSWSALAPLQQCKTRLLTNIYYDTPELLLRQRYMGLRIRTVDDQRELTLKTAGKVIGGLHARPEYNVAIVDDQPDLGLLPQGLFADDELASLNSALQPLFSTDFERQQGVLAVAGATVEIALDHGEITVGAEHSTIAEMELELIEGDAKALLPLARQLMQRQPLRLGLDSKAARGYRLAGLHQVGLITEWQRNETELLAAWQRNEQQLLADNPDAKRLLTTVWEDLQPLLPQHQRWLSHAVAELSAGDNAKEALQRLISEHDYGLTQLALFSRLVD